MAIQTLNAKKRNENSRRSSLRSIRLQGNIPAVVYGSEKESTPITVSEKELIKTLRESGRNGVISLSIDGEKTNVLLTEYQEDFLKNGLIHADFLAVDMSLEIDADVQVVLVGEPQGVKDGGVLQQPVRELTVSAKPNHIPPSIEVDISALGVNETITVKDIKSKASGYTINNEDDQLVASILPPRQEEEIDPGEEQAEGTTENEEERKTETPE